MHAAVLVPAWNLLWVQGSSAATIGHLQKRAPKQTGARLPFDGQSSRHSTASAGLGAASTQLCVLSRSVVLIDLRVKQKLTTAPPVKRQHARFQNKPAPRNCVATVAEIL